MNTLPLNEVDHHYKIILAIEKAEAKQQSELHANWVNVFNKLFKSYLGKRTIL